MVMGNSDLTQATICHLHEAFYNVVMADQKMMF